MVTKMSTLLLRLAAPMQSWDTESKYNKRSTNKEPSKSGVLGLLAAALGILRDDPLNELDELCQLRFGIRVEQEGNLLVDYQNAIGPFHKKEGKENYQFSLSEDGSCIIKYCPVKQITTVQTWRYYLSDAVFLVGLEGKRSKLEKIEFAVNHPVFPLFLGRRSCPPMPPVDLGIRDCDLPTALRDEPWHALDWYQKKWLNKNNRNDLILRIHYEPKEDDTDGPRAIQRDLPISFNQSHRRYGYRGYTVMPVKGVRIIFENSAETDEDLLEEELMRDLDTPGDHDPMKELEE